MKQKLFALSLVFLASFATLVATLWLAGESHASAVPDPRGSTNTPIVTSMQPSSAPNDVDTPVFISGTGFVAMLSGTLVMTSPLVYLGPTGLEDVTWVNSTTLSGIVPWGLGPGVYTLTAVNLAKCR
jgi:hypothetical protein